MLVCGFLCALLHTRPRVQRATGLPCAPSFREEGNEVAKPRASDAARSRRCGRWIVTATPRMSRALPLPLRQIKSEQHRDQSRRLQRGRGLAKQEPACEYRQRRHRRREHRGTGNADGLDREREQIQRGGTGQDALRQRLQRVFTQAQNATRAKPPKAA